MPTIEGDTWKAEVTEEELAAWDIYADSHPHLLGASVGSYEAVLTMFLNHYRRGVNLNIPVKLSQPEPARKP